MHVVLRTRAQAAEAETLGQAWESSRQPALTTAEAPCSICAPGMGASGETSNYYGWQRLRESYAYHDSGEHNSPRFQNCVGKIASREFFAEEDASMLITLYRQHCSSSSGFGLC